MLYKKGLQQLQSDYQTGVEQQQIDGEISRTEGLTIDQSLTNFARENGDVLKQLCLLECNDFQKPHIKKLLNEATKVDKIDPKPNMNRLEMLAKHREIKTKFVERPTCNYDLVKSLLDMNIQEEADVKDDLVKRFVAQGTTTKSSRRSPKKKESIPLPNFQETNKMLYASKSQEDRKKMKELTMNLKSMILGRVTNKERFVDALGVNNLMDDIARTKMAIESELEEIREIQDQSHKSV